jgi:hypothetical protein
MLALALALVVATAPACRPGALTAEASFQGATGSLLGGLKVMNVGPTACTLPERPTVRISWAGKTLNIRRVQLAARPVSLRLLKPGAKAYAALQWRNWCGADMGTFRPRLLVTLGQVPAVLRVELRGPVTAPRCDSSYEPSTLAVGRFVARR